MIMENKKVTDLAYLTDALGGNKKLIKEVMEVFLNQFPLDIIQLNNDVAERSYVKIRQSSHLMKSSTSIMGIASLREPLDTIEKCALASDHIDIIKKLTFEVNEIGQRAIDEITEEIKNY